MSSSHDIVEYLFLEYISSLDFISRVLENVQSEAALDSTLYNLVTKAIETSGYKTDLTYRTLQGNFKKDFLRQGVFRFTQDSLFGEKCEFNLDLYTNYVARLIDKSAAYAAITRQRDTFGDDGLRRAIRMTALEHKWETLADFGSELDGRALEIQIVPRTYLLGEGERQQVVSGLHELRRTAEASELDQQTKAQAMAMIEAAICLSEAPSPNWRIVRELLYSIAAVSTILALAIQVAGMIR